VPGRILLIEDNPTNMELMTFLLESFGHVVLPRTDGAGVIEAVRKERPDIIVCDVQLPTVDGYEVARQLKGDARLSRIPLIAVTAFAMVGDRDKLLGAGFNGYLSKPIDPATFVQQVQEFLPPEQRQERPVPHESSSSHYAAQSPPARGRILVVDDSSVNLSLMSTLLEPAGYEVRTAKSVSGALAMAKESLPDLIITDVHMPGRSGYELARALSEDPQLRSVPCVLLSSTSGEPGIRDAALPEGVKLFVVRPIEPRELLVQIERHIRKEGVS
jgi:two-component system cell cycle response regulator